MQRHLTLALAVLLAATCLPALAAPAVKVGGYVQVRLTDALGAADDGAIDGVAKGVSGFPANGSFGLRRARLSAKATLDDATQAVIEIDASKSEVETKKAFIGYAWNELYFVAGRDTIPFGLELQLSSSALTTLERSMISLTLPEYGTGLKVTPGSVYLPFKTTIAVLNGNDPAKPIAVAGAAGANNGFDDANNAKVVAATTEIPVLGQKAGLSYMTDSAAHYAVGGAVNATLGKVSFAGEYIQSKFDKTLTPLAGGVKNSGWYGLASYALKPSTTLYGRYDTLKPATAGLANKSRVTVGGAIMLGENTELTVEYQSIDDPAKPALNGAYGIQLQAKF